jgi:hypothetical protein
MAKILVMIQVRSMTPTDGDLFLCTELLKIIPYRKIDLPLLGRIIFLTSTIMFVTRFGTRTRWQFINKLLRKDFNPSVGRKFFIYF